MQITRRRGRTLVVGAIAFLVLIASAGASAELRFASGFGQAKAWAKQEVYLDRTESEFGTTYCGCHWRWVGRSGGRVDADSCGYKTRAQPHRAERTEWEHIVPAWTIGHQRQCWQNGGRKNCAANDPVFQQGYVDLHNLTVAVGEYNADRSNFEFSVLPGTPLQHGACPSKIDFQDRRAEPRNEAKGMVARTYFYMADGYGLNLSRQKERILAAWDRQYPPTEWERERNQRIARVQGNSNPYVTGEKTWQVGQRPSRFMLAHQSQRTPVTTARATSVSDSPVTGVSGPIIGNRNSRVYHLPEGCPSYNRVSERNKVPFDSEAAAEAAGFRKAGNCR